MLTARRQNRIAQCSLTTQIFTGSKQRKVAKSETELQGELGFSVGLQLSVPNLKCSYLYWQCQVQGQDYFQRGNIQELNMFSPASSFYSIFYKSFCLLQNCDSKLCIEQMYAYAIQYTGLPNVQSRQLYRGPRRPGAPKATGLFHIISVPTI